MRLPQPATCRYLQVITRTCVIGSESRERAIQGTTRPHWRLAVTASRMPASVSMDRNLSCLCDDDEIGMHDLAARPEGKGLGASAVGVVAAIAGPATNWPTSVAITSAKPSRPPPRERLLQARGRPSVAPR